MPKQVDHQQRKTLIADALMTVAAERGLEAMSVRHVAAVAGVTTGMVQHYFRSKDEMVVFAMGQVRDAIAARSAAENLGPQASTSELLRSLLVQLLPLDEMRRAEGRVGLAFMAYAASHSGIGDAVRADNALLRSVITERLRDDPRLRDRDPSLMATALLALVEGLGLQTLHEDYSPEHALTVFDAHLELLLDAP